MFTRPNRMIDELKKTICEEITQINRDLQESIGHLTSIKTASHARCYFPLINIFLNALFLHVLPPIIFLKDKILILLLLKKCLVLMLHLVR